MMHRNSFIFNFKIILFILLSAVCMGIAGRILNAKFINDSTTIVDGFYAEKKNDIDVLVVGSSNSFCTIDPLVLYEEYGIAAYDFGSSSQPLNLSLLYLKEAFKRQNPRVVALEVNMIPANSLTAIPENRLRWGLTDISLSIDKLTCLYQSLGKVDAEYMSYVFPILRYHGRWKEVSKSDYTYLWKDKTNMGKGYLSTKEIAAEPVDFSDYGSEGETWIEDDVVACFEQIVRLCEQNGAKLVLFKSPRQQWYRYQTRAVAELADKYAIEYIDYNERISEINLDVTADFRDGEHLNDHGAAKVTRHFGNWLSNHCVLPDRREDDNPNSWDEALQYRVREQTMPCEGTADITGCMERLAKDDNYVAVVTYGADKSRLHQWIYRGGEVLYHKEWKEPGVEHYRINRTDIVLARTEATFQIMINDIEYYEPGNDWSVIVYDTVTDGVVDVVSYANE